MSKLANDVQKHLLAYARLEMSGCPAEAARCASVHKGASWGPRSEKVGSGKNVFGTLNVEFTLTIASHSSRP